MRKKPSNPDDSMFDWDAEAPHDGSPDALMFLLAADEAANTPERRQMLDGLLEGDEREVQRVLESDADHGDVLDDDFFWCYMGLALCQGNRRFWQVVNDWGYSLHSVVKLPDSKPGAEGMSLACWGATFAEPERLDWLERLGELEPWRGTHSVGRGALLSAGEVGMLNGSAAHFNYWLPKWAIHIQESRLEFNRRNKVEVSCNIPTCISVMVGMMEWKKLPANPHNPAPNYPEPEELQRRLDAMLKALTDAFYAKAQPGQMLAALTANPPVSGREKVFSALVKWAITRDTNPFEQPLELQALKAGEFEWCRALVEQGSPLERTPGGVSLGQALVSCYLASKPTEDTTALLQTVQLFTTRAKQEAPALLEALWNRKIPNSAKTSEAFPEIAAALGRQWDKLHKLLKLGCPLMREGEPTQLGNVLLIKAAKNDMDDPDNEINKKHTASSVFLQWVERGQEEEDEQALDGLWNQPVPIKGGGTTWPEHAVLDAGDNEWLMATLIKHGCPLARRDHKGRELGFRLLRKTMTANDTGCWETFRRRAIAEGGTSIPEAYLHQDGGTLQADFAANPAKVKTALNAVELDVRWGGDLQQAPVRPRF